MANEVHEIPIVPGSVFTEDPHKPVRGGHSRFVPNVPIGQEPNMVYAPCIWKSHYTVEADCKDGSKETAYECLLLLSRNPILTVRAEIAVNAWQHFGNVLVEW